MMRLTLMALCFSAAICGAAVAQRMTTDDDTGGELVLLEACAEAPLGSPGCDPKALVDAVSMLSPARYRFFHDAGMESYAIWMAMTTAAEAVENRVAGGDCMVADDALRLVGDLWFFYVELPPDASEAIIARYNLFDRVTSNMMAYLQEGTC